MKTGYLLKDKSGQYYVHKNVYGPITEAKVFFDFQEARQKAMQYVLTLEHVEVRYKVMENP